MAAISQRNFPFLSGWRARRTSDSSGLREALADCRLALLGVGLLSGIINVLALSGSFFMLEVYDRVLPSRSVPTLIGLAAVVATLYLFQGAMDVVRGRILVRVGAAVDEALNGRIFRALVQLPLKGSDAADGLQSVRDLDQVRGFLSGGGPMAFFDLPWIPLYLSICFLFHFWIGMTAFAGAVLLVSLTLLAEVMTRRATAAAVTFAGSRNMIAEVSRRNAEVIQALGMTDRIEKIWTDSHGKYVTSHQNASDITGGLGAVSKVTRMMLQSAVLGVGAYLVIQQQSTAGIIIASSILTARALAPVEIAIAHWRGFLSARHSWRRLNETFRTMDAKRPSLQLPTPVKSLIVEAISVAPPGSQKVVVEGVSFSLFAGQAVGILGPNASGKSSLVRALAGAWPTLRGNVRLDGAPLDQWDPETRGRYVGYLPQDIELLSGTVAQNICRFEAAPRSQDIVSAAAAAGVHDLILRLPDGYETPIGEGGFPLSGGHRQRVALARAMYGNPFLVILDEPDSNLDEEGEQALSKAVRDVRARGGIVVMVAHRSSLLANVELLLLLQNGRAMAFGPKDEVLRRFFRPVPTAGLQAAPPQRAS